MKREKISDDEADHDSSQVLVLFNKLPLDKKRALMPELLKSARVVHGLFIDPVEPKFRRWITSGNEKLLPEEDVEKLWQFWTLVKKVCNYAYSAFWAFEDDGPIVIHIYLCQTEEEESKNKFIFYSQSDDKIKTTVGKEAYFDWILKNTTPRQVTVEDEAMGSVYDFSHTSCAFRCNCSIDDPNAFGERHAWNWNVFPN